MKSIIVICTLALTLGAAFLFSKADAGNTEHQTFRIERLSRVHFGSTGDWIQEEGPGSCIKYSHKGTFAEFEVILANGSVGKYSITGTGANMDAQWVKVCGDIIHIPMREVPKSAPPPKPKPTGSR